MFKTEISAIAGIEHFSAVANEEGKLPAVVEDADIVANSVAITVDDENVLEGDFVLRSPAFASVFPNRAPKFVQ